MTNNSNLVPDTLVPAVFAQTYLTLAQQRGIAPETMIQLAGLPPDIQHKPGGEVPLLHMKLLVEAILAQTGDHGLGLEMGFALPPTAFGNLGSAILCCKTMRDVIELTLRFQFLFARGITFSVLLKDPTAIIDLNLSMPLPEPFRHLTLEITLTCLIRGIALLTHARPDELEVWFACPRPDYPAALLAQLGRVRFGMPSNQLRFSTALLDKPLPMHNPTALKFAVDQCQREETLLDKGRFDLLEKVRRRLQYSANGYPSVHDISKQLCMTTRSLRRQLESEGTNFKNLLEEAKRRDAIVLLDNTGIEIQRVANLLGYEDPANFTRAFKSWTGQTPSQYRNHHQQANSQGATP